MSKRITLSDREQNFESNGIKKLILAKNASYDSCKLSRRYLPNLVSYAKRNIKLRRHRFLHASFCMSSKRNAKSSRLGFVLHSRGIAICARATAHNVDMVLFSSQRLSQVTQ